MVRNGSVQLNCKPPLGPLFSGSGMTSKLGVSGWAAGDTYVHFWPWKDASPSLDWFWGLLDKTSSEQDIAFSITCGTTHVQTGLLRRKIRAVTMGDLLSDDIRLVLLCCYFWSLLISV